MRKLFYFLFCILCVLILFQDFMGIFLFNLGVPRIILQFFLSFKDIIIGTILLLNLMTSVIVRKNIPFNMTIFFFTGYAIIVFGYLVRFGGLNNIGNITNDLRSLIFPIYAYLAGYTTFYFKKERMIAFVEKVAFASVLLSLIFYLMGEKFLHSIRVLDYTENIRGYFGITFQGLPSAYFTHLSNITIFRLSGPVLNSVGTATLYTFVAGFSIACYRFIRKDKFRKVLLTLLILSIFLTFSRGAIIGFLLGVLTADFLWSAKVRAKKSMLIIYCIIAILFIAFFGHFANIMKETYTLTDPSARSHYNALLRSWDYLKHNWMGSGIGSVGMWKWTDSSGGAGENSFASIIGQVGIFAFILLAAAYGAVLKNLIRHKENRLNYALLIFAIAALFNAMFSPSLLAVTPMILFWFFVGYSEGAGYREYETG